MKKKLLVISLMISLIFSLSACAKKEVVLPASFNQEYYESMAAYAVLQVSQYDDESLTILANDAEDYFTEQTLGLPIDVFSALCAGTVTSHQEAGNTVDFAGDVQYEVSGIHKEIVTMTIPVQFDNYVVNYEFTFEPNPKAEYNPEVDSYILTQGVVATQYSFGELMQKAGMNTLMGMGIVFIVLIFISFIISLFKFLPGSGAKQQKAKEEAKKAAELKATAKNALSGNDAHVASSQPEPVKTENLMDDKELVAVITAAIYAANASSTACPSIVSTDRLVVRSIKRVSR